MQLIILHLNGKDDQYAAELAAKFARENSMLIERAEVCEKETRHHFGSGDPPPHIRVGGLIKTIMK